MIMEKACSTILTFNMHLEDRIGACLLKARKFETSVLSFVRIGYFKPQNLRLIIAMCADGCRLSGTFRLQMQDGERRIG